VGANSSEGSDGRICEWNGRRAAIVDFGSAGQHKFSGLPLPRLWRFENAGIQDRAFAIRDMTPSACALCFRPSIPRLRKAAKTGSLSFAQSLQNDMRVSCDTSRHR
jgi:hypothetical protein